MPRPTALATLTVPVACGLLAACAAPPAPTFPPVDAFPGQVSSWELTPPPSPVASAELPPFVTPVLADVAWPTPPRSVACLIEGREAIVHGVEIKDDVGTAVASLGFSPLETIWGVPTRLPDADPPGLWVHARSEGVAVTGRVDPRAVKLTLGRELEVVRGHAWFDAYAPLAPTSAAGGLVRLELSEDLPGVDRLHAEAPCAELSTEPPPMEPRLDPSAGLELVGGEPRRGSHYARGMLALRAAPGAKPFVEIAAGGMEVDVVAMKTGHARIKLRSTYARFDAWVDEASITTEPPELGSSFGVGCACGRLPPAPPQWVLSRTTDARLGVWEPGADARGVTLAGGTPVRVVHRVDGFYAVRPEGTAIRAPGSNDYWVPAEVVAFRERERPRALGSIP